MLLSSLLNCLRPPSLARKLDKNLFHHQLNQILMTLLVCCMLYPDPDIHAILVARCVVFVSILSENHLVIEYICFIIQGKYNNYHTYSHMRPVKTFFSASFFFCIFGVVLVHTKNTLSILILLKTLNS